MRFLRRFLIRLLNFATRHSADQRLQEEIAEHLAFQTEENLRAGMSPTEARRQAAIKLGAAEAIRQDHHAEQSLPFFENLLFDVRYAVRMLVRAPGFSLISIATIALGIGATTAIYSVIDATLLHPLPYPNPSELVRIEANLPGVGAHDVGISIPEFERPSELGNLPKCLPLLFRLRKCYRRLPAHAHRRSNGLTELLRGARSGCSVGPHLRSARRHTRLQP